MTLFDAYVIVDWSAEARPKTGADSLWYVCLERRPDGLVETALANPPTRAACLDALLHVLTDLTARGLSVLAGFDFAFGYPAGFAAKVAPREPTWRGVWKRLAAGLHDDAGNSNDRFALAAALNTEISGGGFPFWGHPAKGHWPGLTADKPQGYGALAEKRITETLLPGTQPVWKLAYPGGVGSQTLTGIPALFRLRHHPWLAGLARLWPFEADALPIRRPGVVLAEVWPPLATPVPGAEAVKDAAQVRGLARHFARLDQEQRLEPLFSGYAHLPPAGRDRVESEEGWILGAQPPVPAWEKNPAEIYRQSFAQIRQELDLSQVPEDLRPLVLRVVHACGMPDILADLKWSPGAGRAGHHALESGAPVLVDAEMVAHGIIRDRLPKENTVLCTLNDPRTPDVAAEHGTTRSAAAVELWLPLLEGAVVAIGNAPTALFRLLELIRQGAPSPALVLGFPVGFVGAAESKEALARSGLPHVTLLGRRGGSAMAAAAVNALAAPLEG